MFSGMLAFVDACHDAGVSLAIVSHKTRNPYLGSDTDLHATARGWLDQNGLGSEAAFFELTKEAKLARIETLGLTHFVDDLPEFLSLPGFPPLTRKMLFDPLGLYVPAADVLRVASWSEITTVLLCQSMAA
jgi:hypothetical protein